MKDYVIDGIDSKYTSVETIRMGLLVGYLMALSLVVIFVWRPFLRYLAENVCNERFIMD